MYVAYTEYTVFDGNRTAGSRIGSSFEQSSDLEITNNTFEGSEWHGVGLVQTTRTLVRGNEVSNSGVGVLVSLSTDNTITRNRAMRTDTGFYTDADSAGNSLVRNTTKESASYGFVDTSLGTKSLGTKNTYKGNRCVTNGIAGSDPNGLCRAR